MKALTFFVFIMSVLTNSNNVTAQNFLQDQLTKSRVKEAYGLHADSLDALLTKHGMDSKHVDVFLRAFKYEKSLEVWVKHSDSSSYQRLKQYDFCVLSGRLGPKTKQGDYQVPEGFYHIDRFNPWSTFHLSMGINYPNSSDKARNSGNLGGDIFIHGDCVSIGCIPITNDCIKELYVLCALAKNSGQRKIPVHIFPFQMTERNMSMVKSQIQDDSLYQFWENLQKGYESFEENNHQLPKVSVSREGDYLFQ